jgi:hypothetical protein
MSATFNGRESREEIVDQLAPSSVTIMNPKGSYPDYDYIFSFPTVTRASIYNPSFAFPPNLGSALQCLTLHGKIKTESANLLGEALAQNVSIRELRFQEGFSKTAKGLVKGIAANTGIRTFRFNIAGLTPESMSAIFHTNCKIEDITIDGSTRSKIGQWYNVPFQPLAPYLLTDSVHTVKMYHMDLTGVEFSKFLRPGIKNLTFYFCTNFLSVAGDVFPYSENLESVYLSTQAKELVELWKVIDAAPNLKSLELNSHLHCLERVLESISVHPHLEDLIFHFLDDSQKDMVIRMLRVNHVLQDVRVYDCPKEVYRLLEINRKYKQDLDEWESAYRAMMFAWEISSVGMLPLEVVRRIVPKPLPPVKTPLQPELKRQRV